MGKSSNRIIRTGSCLLIYVCFAACFAAEKKSVDNHLNDHNNETLPIERLKELQIGKAKLADVHAIFGIKERKRRTYRKTLLPKLYNDKEYNVFRLINYTSYSVDRTDMGNLIETRWKESIDVTFFFDQSDNLLFYSIRHRHNDGNGKDHAGKWHNAAGDPDELWPGAVCDGIFHDIYETQRVQGSRYFSPVTTQKCHWLGKLKADVASGVVK